MVDRPDFFNAEQALFTNSVQSQASPQNFGSPDVTTPIDNIYEQGLLFHVGAVADHIPNWSIYPARRDRLLRDYWKQEPIASGAIYSLASRMKSLPYKLSGKDDLQREVRTMLDAADFGRGLGELISKTITDLATQDNGFFWEVIGTGNPASDTFTPIGVAYLDSAQCYRTFDPTYPVMYIDPITSKRHRMHRKTIISGSSMPQPNELARGIGFCGLSRALRSVQLMRSVLEYRYEKATGTFERGIIYGKGLTIRTLRRLMQEAQLQGEADGLSRIGRMPAYVTPQGIELDVLDLASIPENFDSMSETELYVYTLALAFGVDAREFWSVTQSGATKADASVQNMKARGKGLADMISTVERAITTYLLPDEMAFTFDFVDDERDASVANKNRVVVDTVTRAKQEKMITPLEARAQLIHDGVLNKRVLENAEKIANFGNWQEKRDEIESNADNEGGLSDNNVQANNQPITENPQNADSPSEESDKSVLLSNSDTVWLYAQEAKGLKLNKRYSKVNTWRLVTESGHYTGIKSIEGYRASLRAIVRGYMSGQVTFFNTVSAMDGSITRHFTQAWRDGAKREGIEMNEITSQERAKLNELTRDEMQFVIPFVEWMQKNMSAQEGDDISFQSAFSRIDLWVKRYSRVEAKARLMAAKNKKFEWKWNPEAVHCTDCKRLNGRVYRASVWSKWEVEPQSPMLECFGNCKCEFIETEKAVTSGRPPTLSGAKAKRKAQGKYNVAYNAIKHQKPHLFTGF